MTTCLQPNDGPELENGHVHPLFNNRDIGRNHVTGRDQMSPFADQGIAGNSNKPSLTTDEAAVKLTRDNRKWGDGEFGSPVTVTVSFASEPGAGLSVQQRVTVEEALRIISSVTQVTFVAAADGAPADIAFETMRGGGGVAQYTAQIGQYGLEMHRATVWLGDASLSLALHEIGHAMGLAHPGDYDRYTRGYADDAEYREDTKQYTVMSYFDGQNSGAKLDGHQQSSDGVWEYRGGATGLGLHDIAALQKLYGTNSETNNGDTVYGFNSNTGDDALTLKDAGDWIHAALWDAGGVDKIDMSAYGQNQMIDLRPESFSSTGGLEKNVSIAKGVIIENAIAGEGDDILNGNQVTNVLMGNDGDDVIRGHGGNDQLSGGKGKDMLEGGSGDDGLSGGEGMDTARYSGKFSDYSFSFSASGAIIITNPNANDGVDTVEGVETFIFSDTTKSISALNDIARADENEIDPLNVPEPVVEPVSKNPPKPETHGPAPLSLDATSPVTETENPETGKTDPVDFVTVTCPLPSEEPDLAVPAEMPVADPDYSAILQQDPDPLHCEPFSTPLSQTHLMAFLMTQWLKNMFDLDTLSTKISSNENNGTLSAGDVKSEPLDALLLGFLTQHVPVPEITCLAKEADVFWNVPQIWQDELFNF